MVLLVRVSRLAFNREVHEVMKAHNSLQRRAIEDLF